MPEILDVCRARDLCKKRADLRECWLLWLAFCHLGDGREGLAVARRSQNRRDSQAEDLAAAGSEGACLKLWCSKAKARRLTSLGPAWAT